MRPAFRISLPVACLLLAGILPARAQEGVLIPADDPAYAWIARLQDRGFLTGLLPGAAPYTVGEVRRALLERAATDEISTRWMERLGQRIGPPATGDRLGFSAEAGARASSSRRLDPVRELGDKAHAYPFAEATAAAEWGRLTLQTSARVDAYYDLDPDGLDAALRAFSRSENTYLAWDTPHAAASIGRYSTHWGLPDEPGLFVSSNPRTMDGLRLRLGGRRIALRTVFAELDAITGDGRFTGLAGDDSVASGAERRWLASHRLDWRPSPDLVLTVFESVLFSGAGSGWSLKYLNPVQPAVIELDNRPKNDENNGLVGIGVWARSGSTRWYGQIAVDDFDFLHADERASFAAHLSVLRSGVTSRVDAGLTATAVASRTYNTFQPEGRYIHLGRGLATQFSDFVEVSLFARACTAALPLVIEPRLTGLWQGERDLRQSYDGADNDFPTILVGTVERTIRAAVRFSLESSARFGLFIDAGVNRVDDVAHRRGEHRTRPSITASVRWRLASSSALRLDD